MPTEVSQLHTFHLFPDLPVELQMQIFEYATTCVPNNSGVWGRTNYCDIAMQRYLHLLWNEDIDEDVGFLHQKMC